MFHRKLILQAISLHISIAHKIILEILIVMAFQAQIQRVKIVQLPQDQIFQYVKILRSTVQILADYNIAHLL